MTEVTGPGYKQERNFFATLVDPFDIYGMIRGKDKETRFWDEDADTGAVAGAGSAKERARIEGV